MELTIRMRFALWIALFLLFTLVAFGAILTVSVSNRLRVILDQSLAVTASESIAAMNIESGRVNFSDGSMNEIAAAPHDSEFSFRIVDLVSGATQEFGDLAPLTNVTRSTLLRREGENYYSTVTGRDGRPLRVFTTPVVELGRTVAVLQVAHSTESIRDAITHLLITLALAAPVLVVVSAFGGYLLARRALRPVDELTQTARTLSADNLDLTLAIPHTSDEVGRLARTFDEMLSRIHRSFTREKQFTSDISHAIRTPLMAMQTIIHYLNEKDRSAGQQRAAIEDLGAAVAQLGVLTERMLSIARVEQDSEMSRSPVDLSATVHDLCETLRPVATGKGIGLTEDVPPGLIILGSEDEIISMLMNLLENAVKYTDCGEIRVTASREHDGHLLVSISDTGLGMSSDELDKVFDRFYRAPGVRQVDGSGLGLAISRRIARAMGGDVTARSEPRKGSEFTIRLPVGLSEEKQESRVMRRSIAPRGKESEG